jgi:hypothetical protein
MPDFLKVATAFEKEGISYVIVGGLACVLHGHVRVTADVDVVVRLDDANAASAVRTLLSLGYQSRLPVNPLDFARADIRESWVREKGLMVLSFFDPEDVTQSVDLFASYPLEYSQLNDRAVQKDVGGVNIRFCSLDDLIAIKKAAGRAIDLDDVKALEEIRRHG